MDIEYVNYVGLSKVIIFIIMKERIKTNNALLLKDVVCVDMKDLVNREHEWIHNREGDAFFKICRDCHIKIRVYE